MICNRLGSQLGYEPKWFNRLIDALPMANNEDYGLIWLIDTLGTDGLHWMCLFGVKNFRDCLNAE
jgi:hypothetical protein